MRRRRGGGGATTMACIKGVNRSASVALSPEGPYMATGTMAGAVDLSFSTSASLEIFKIDFQSDDHHLPLLAESSSSERFNRLSWGKSVPNSDEYSLGLIDGGLIDGTIGLWNPAPLIRSESDSNAFVGQLSNHKGPVRGLEFNTMAPNLLASGADDGEICIWDLVKPKEPTHFPPLREWAKANGINNPKCGTFNSYSPSLLVIFHFQTCAPAILPPLEEIYPGNMADELIGVRADVERRMEEIAVSNIQRFKNKRRNNRCSLSELFTFFFGKFLDLINRTKEQGVCTYSGRWENISTNTRWLPRTYSIFIEDPFEQPQNTARAVDQSRLRKISSAFQTTYYLLISPNITRESLIPSLLRHEVSGCFPGAAFAIPRADVRTYPRSNQNASFHNHSSSQHHKGQNGKQSILGQPPAQVANQQSSRETHCKGENGKHLLSGSQAHVANQHSTREKSGSQCQNVDRPETASKGQSVKQYRRRQQNVDRPEMVSKGQNGEHGSQHQNVDGPEILSKGQNDGQYGIQPRNVDRAETVSKEQNGKRSSTGQGQAAKQQLPREKSGSRSQNVDRPKTESKLRNGKKLSPGPTKKGFKEAKKGQRGKIVNKYCLLDNKITYPTNSCRGRNMDRIWIDKKQSWRGKCKYKFLQFLSTVHHGHTLYSLNAAMMGLHKCVRRDRQQLILQPKVKMFGGQSGRLSKSLGLVISRVRKSGVKFVNFFRDIGRKE